MAFGGFDQRGGQQPMAEINTTPLVDVMLVLLVIFIITAPLITPSLRLDLPDAKATAAAEPIDAIQLAIDEKGIVFWNAEPLSGMSELEQRLASAARIQPQPSLQLRADRNTRYQAIADILSSAQQAGITRIGFVTDPVAPARAPAGGNR
jgi:biopolymer transport protein ExbD